MITGNQHAEYLCVVRNDVALLGNVDTVKEFSDILVAHPADTLDRGGCRRFSADSSYDSAVVQT